MILKRTSSQDDTTPEKLKLSSPDMMERLRQQRMAVMGGAIAALESNPTLNAALRAAEAAATEKPAKAAQLEKAANAWKQTVRGPEPAARPTQPVAPASSEAPNATDTLEIDDPIARAQALVAAALEKGGQQ